ncbi:MAG TPA: ATP-binding protein, partial [Bryobacteraceae bacterium]|nr:ATP-binding protein [Bryobacteraceae bacterium]
RMDPSQLQQIIMNLIINAGEAIGQGSPGRITVATSMRDVGKAFVDAIGGEVAPGRYVSIEVSDTGSGIDPNSVSKIFDPFFTTKFTGRGLGLAAVAGIIRTQNGAITVDSTPGRGTTFRVYLRAAATFVQEPEERPDASRLGTVLVIDDEASVRDFICTALRRRGYHVLTASDGREAVAICEREAENIDAAIIDVVMPSMGANELIPTMKSRQPNMRILLTSGYSESEARRYCAAYPRAAFIQKPYTTQQVVKAVEELFGAAGER